MSLSQRRGVHRRGFLTLSAAAAASACSADEPAQKPPVLTPAAEAQIQAIIAKHGAQMTAEQKADLKRLIAGIAKTTETLNAFPLPENSEPALAFHVYRADRR
jgi:hypothetical protein